MYANRVGTSRGRYDPVGRFSVGTARRTALLAIEEVLGELERLSAESPVAAELPAVVPTRLTTPGPARRPARVHLRWWRRVKGTLGIVALALALAISVGTFVGSGLLSAQDRFNAERVAAQRGTAEVYGLPEVHGHPGAAPTKARSGSIREFLGMAKAF